MEDAPSLLVHCSKFSPLLNQINDEGLSYYNHNIYVNGEKEVYFGAVCWINS